MTLELFIQLFLNGMCIGAIYVLLVIGLQVIVRTTGIINFAHGQFYTIGAYALWGAFVLLALNMGLAMVVAIVVMLLLGALTQCLVFQFVQKRFQPDTPLSSRFLMSAMASVGLMMILARAILLVFGTETRGVPSIFPQMIIMGGIRLPAEKLAALLISVLVMFAVYLFFFKTKLGESMRAVSSDAEASSLVGINSSLIYLVSFALGCALAGIAGVLIAPMFSVKPGMGEETIFMAMLVMVVGGARSYRGGVFGGITVGLAASFGFQFIGIASYVLIFVASMVFLVIRPEGLFGELLD